MEKEKTINVLYKSSTIINKVFLEAFQQNTQSNQNNPQRTRQSIKRVYATFV